jgi:hypothetical protein
MPARLCRLKLLRWLDCDFHHEVVSAGKCTHAFHESTFGKKVKIPGFRKGVVEEGRFEIAKTIVECLKSNRWDGALAR